MAPIEQLPGLPAAAFHKADTAPDADFYACPRFVTHIDDGAVAAVTAIYAALLQAGADVLDLMSSWVSHLPPDVTYNNVTGLGMNEEELAANPRLNAHVMQDLNEHPALPFGDAAFDAALVCVSVQYLQRPVEVFAEVRRVLRPGAPFIVTFSNRCFSSKAVAIWQAMQGAEQQRLVEAYMRAAGFEALSAQSAIPPWGDPLWAVIGRAPGL